MPTVSDFLIGLLFEAFCGGRSDSCFGALHSRRLHVGPTTHPRNCGKVKNRKVTFRITRDAHTGEYLYQTKKRGVAC